MADHIIYIKALNSASGNNPTQPSTKTSATTPFAEREDKGAGIKKIAGIVTNPDSLIGKVAGEGVSAAGVIGAVVVASAVIADKAISIIEPFITRASGDYRFNIEYSNFKNTLGLIFRPVSTGLGIANRLQEIDVVNQRKEQNRLLVGDSIINSYGGNV